MKILITLDEFKSLHKKKESVIVDMSEKVKSLEDAYNELNESSVLTIYRQRANSEKISITLSNRLDFHSPFDFIEFIIKHNPMLSEEEIYDMATNRCPKLLIDRNLPTYIDLVIRTTELTNSIKEETNWS